ncbi:MAG: HEPN domain-containing protein [Chloroflexi bacterium]|nr:HEPN domain-containing protein [Chloroflexota bacterium]
MNELTVEWVAKAEGDYATAGRELQVDDRPNYDAVCFHAQQTAEKYMKAFLQENNTAFPKTHSLIELLELSLPLDDALEHLRPVLVRLGRYAVRYRYPGETASKSEAQMAYKAATTVRVIFHARLTSEED